MKISIYIILLSSFIFLSCENTSLVDVKIEGKENIVVRAEVVSGETFKGVSFNRTVPVGDTTNSSFTGVEDVYAYLLINGVQIVPLHHTNAGMYKPAHDNLYVNAGDTYELYARINGKYIYSKTKAPSQPHVVSTSYKDGYFDIVVKSNGEEVYGAVWVLIGTEYRAADFNTVEKADPNGGNIHIKTMKLNAGISPSSSNLKVLVYAFDTDYQAYFKSKGQSQSADSSGYAGGGNTHWNIEGENVIGMFIGIASGAAIEP